MVISTTGFPITRNKALISHYSWFASSGQGAVPTPASMNRASSGFQLGIGANGPIRISWPGAPSEADFVPAKLHDGCLGHLVEYRDVPGVIAAEIPIANMEGTLLDRKAIKPRAYVNGFDKKGLPVPIAAGAKAESSALLLNILIQRPSEDFIIDLTLNAQGDMPLYKFLSPGEDSRVRIPVSGYLGGENVELKVFHEREKTKAEVIVKDRELGGSFPILSFTLKDGERFLGRTEILASVLSTVFDSSDVNAQTHSIAIQHMLYYLKTGKCKPENPLRVPVPDSPKAEGKYSSITLYGQRDNINIKGRSVTLNIPKYIFRSEIKETLLEPERAESGLGTIVAFAAVDGIKLFRFGGITVVDKGRLLTFDKMRSPEVGITNVDDVPRPKSLGRTILLSALATDLGDPPDVLISDGQSRVTVFGREQGVEDRIIIPKAARDIPGASLRLVYVRISDISKGYYLVAKKGSLSVPLYYYELIHEQNLVRGTIRRSKSELPGFKALLTTTIWNRKRMKKIEEKSPLFKFTSLTEMIGFLSFILKTRTTLPDFWQGAFDKSRKLFATVDQFSEDSRVALDLITAIFNGCATDPSVFCFLDYLGFLDDVIPFFQKMEGATNPDFRRGVAKIVHYSNKRKRNFPGISTKERDAAAKEFVVDERVKARLAAASSTWVAKIARKYLYRCSIGEDDLIAAGNVGVAEALKRWNPEIGVKFISYAYYWIRREILGEIYRVDRNVRLPIWFNQALHVTKRYWVEARPPEYFELRLIVEGFKDMIFPDGRNVDIDETVTLMVMHWNERADSLTVENEDGPASQKDLVYPDQRTPEQIILDREHFDRFRGLVARLEPAEARAFSLVWGLDEDANYSDPNDQPKQKNEKFLTLKAVGIEMNGVTRERARQILARATGELSQAWMRVNEGQAW